MPIKTVLMRTILPRKRFYFLVLPLVGLLAVAGYQTSRSWTLSSDLSVGPCELDSFSKPSLAVAILKQEAGRRFYACMERQPPVPDQGPSDGSRAAAALQAPGIQPLAKLRQQTRELNVDLDSMLLNACDEKGLWNAYLDCYLQLLQGASEAPLVLNCARNALLISDKCGRTEEVLDAMRHVTRFHRQLKTAEGLRSLVEEWATKNPRSFEVGAQ
jgi:hypothetical protein